MGEVPDWLSITGSGLVMVSVLAFALGQMLRGGGTVGETDSDLYIADI